MLVAVVSGKRTQGSVAMRAPGSLLLLETIAEFGDAVWAPAGAQRKLLWERRDKIVEPFGETVQQVFARVSAMRDRLDGPQVCAPPPIPPRQLDRHVCCIPACGGDPT